MDSNILKIYRHELKYILSQMEYEVLKRLMAVTMNMDENSGTGEDYYIRSLYFDTVADTDYFDKIRGISERKKIRLRLYDTETEQVKLEIKNKQNDYSVKETMIISRTDAQELLQQNYQVLSKYKDEVSGKVCHNFMLGCYSPKVIVDYDREAYTLPIENVRITFDKRVRVAKTADLFDKNLLMCNLMPEHQVILEVKFNRYLPRHVSNILSTVEMQRMSISKYCMARELVG